MYNVCLCVLNLAPALQYGRVHLDRAIEYRYVGSKFSTSGIESCSTEIIQGRNARKGDLSHADYCNFVNFLILAPDFSRRL
jgi:hypothetical protein